MFSKCAHSISDRILFLCLFFIENSFQTLSEKNRDACFKSSSVLFIKVYYHMDWSDKILTLYQVISLGIPHQTNSLVVLDWLNIFNH